MFITIINDCQSDNERGRQESRFMSLLECPVSFVGVSSDFSIAATLEAAGNLIDVMDAAEDRKGIIALNVAPRGEQKKDGHNGTSFCYFSYQNLTVISTVRGLSLSLVKQLGLVSSINLVDVDQVMAFAGSQGLVSDQVSAYVPTSQFRSFDFVPRLAKWLHDGVALPHQETSIDVVEDMPPTVWYVDAFGNAKTTLVGKTAGLPVGEKVKTSLGEFTFYQRLKDLPKGETAMYIGSSGIGDLRFIEIATQMQAGSAAKSLGIKVGDEFSLA